MNATQTGRLPRYDFINSLGEYFQMWLANVKWKHHLVIWSWNICFVSHVILGERNGSFDWACLNLIWNSLVRKIAWYCWLNFEDSSDIRTELLTMLIQCVCLQALCSDTSLVSVCCRFTHWIRMTDQLRSSATIFVWLGGQSAEVMVIVIVDHFGFQNVQHHTHQ